MGSDQIHGWDVLFTAISYPHSLKKSLANPPNFWEEEHKMFEVSYKNQNK